MFIKAINSGPIAFNSSSVNASTPEHPLQTAQRMLSAEMVFPEPMEIPTLKSEIWSPGVRFENNKSNGSVTLSYGLAKKSVMMLLMTAWSDLPWMAIDQKWAPSTE